MLRVQPFLPAHKWIVPQPRNSLPSRHIILPHRCPASLNQSRAVSPRGARELFLQRTTPRAERGAFLSCFLFPSCLFFLFSLFFKTPRLRFKKHSFSFLQISHQNVTAFCMQSTVPTARIKNTNSFIVFNDYHVVSSSNYFFSSTGLKRLKR